MLNIALQEQVRTDIYNILKSYGLEPQTPDCVAIYTENGYHHMYFYPFNAEYCAGIFRYEIKNIKIKTDYEFKDLEKLIIDKLKEVNMSSRDLQAMIKAQRCFIKELLDRFENKQVQIQEPLNVEHIVFSINGCVYTLAEIRNIFNSFYFNGLRLEEIAELAKKSIRLEKDNSKLREIEELVNEFKSEMWTTSQKNNFIDNVMKIIDK